MKHLSIYEYVVISLGLPRKVAAAFCAAHAEVVVRLASSGSAGRPRAMIDSANLDLLDAFCRPFLEPQRLPFAALIASISTEAHPT